MRIPQVPSRIYAGRSNAGFTLVELVVVIVILGVLAATALPRFINIGTQARVAAINGVAGGLEGAKALSASAYFAFGNNARTIANMNGTDVTVNPGTSTTGTAVGIPTATWDGIAVALSCPITKPGDNVCGGLRFDFASPSGSDPTATIQPVAIPTSSTSCLVTYNGRTGTVNAISTGC